MASTYFHERLEDWGSDFRKAVLPFVSSTSFAYGLHHMYHIIIFLLVGYSWGEGWEEIKTRTAGSGSYPSHFNIKSDYLYPSVVPDFYFTYMEA